MHPRANMRLRFVSRFWHYRDLYVHMNIIIIIIIIIINDIYIAQVRKSKHD